MKLYNSLTRKKEELKPMGKEVTMYSCGPTVYSFAHIGNMRAYVFVDQLYRAIKYNHYKLNSVMNITDVGHLTSDADEGDDKMLVASKREHKSPYEIAKFYTNAFMEDIKKLNITLPNHIVPATTVIKEIISFIKGLMNKGYAYETSKGIYFNIKKFKNYGQLSGVKLEEKLMGARIEVDDEKINPADFALWIKAPKEHIMQWESPWGMGYPGWHIECSVIGRKFFGENFDIHTGGIDHKAVHHENEIAQNDALNGHKTVNFWVHCEFMQVDGVKMSKSLGNVYTLNDLIAKGYSAMDYRYFLYNSHYSKITNFTFEGLDNAKKSFRQFSKLVLMHKNGNEKVDENQLEIFDKEFTNAVNDDINMPLALGITWKMLKTMPKSKKVFEKFEKFNQVLGFIIEEKKQETQIIPQEIQELAEKRWKLKIQKDFVTADKFRLELEQKGYVIIDKKDSYSVIKKI